MATHIRAGVLLLLLGFILVRFAQPYVHSYQFDRLVDQEVLASSQRAQAGQIHRRLLEQGRSMGFRINPDDIEVERLVRGFRVSVKYAAPLDLFAYKTQVEFDYAASTASGQLE